MYTHKHQTLSHRIVKQTLQASGANVTPEHIEEVSLSSLFLLEAAKKIDREFGVTPKSQMHTVREANSDKRKVALHLMEKAVTKETAGRTTPKFVHPVDKGWERLSNSDWLSGVLSHTLVEEDEVQQGELELDYELFDMF